MIDTHAHLDDKRLYKRVGELLERAEQKGVERVINIGISLDSSRKSIELAQNYENVYATVGIHPHDSKNVPKNYIQRLGEMANEEQVIALGEMGLDYFKNISPQDNQLRVFKEQVSLARELGMPVVIHDRDAHEDVLETIQEIKGVRGVFHCFSGDWQVAYKVLELGFHISFTGTITFKKAGKLKEVVRKTPLDKMMIETDCPYLAPEPFRGKLNEPAYVRLVGDAVAEEKNMSLEEVAKITTENAVEFFNLDDKIF